jgi:serine/threonine-protein kinase
MVAAPGSRVGNVVLQRTIGQGAMGTVWVGEHTTLGSEVAVKILHPARALDQASFRRFEQEAKGVAQLDSPHVVRVFDYGMTDDGDPYIVMERLVGRDLKSFIQDDGPLSPTLTLTVARQLCRALRYAHGRGVLHRDIKPANVFLVEADGEPFVKVLDFGIAKYCADDLDLTATGQLVGTPYYMSPEQFMSPRDVDHRSDLWSVAVVLYACMVGKLPFLGEAVGAISIATYTGDYRPPTELCPSLPAAFDDFIAKAFAVDPNGRYQDADALYRGLEHALNKPVLDASDAEHIALARTLPHVDGLPTSTDETTLLRATVHDPAPRWQSDESAQSDDNRETPLVADGTDGTSTTTAATFDPPPRLRWRPTAFAAVVIVVALVGWRALSDSSTPTAAVTPSASAASDLGPAPSSAAPVATPADVMTGRLRIDPPSAEVRVNGSRQAVRDGHVDVVGQPGDTFVVDVSDQDRRLQQTVVLKRDGETVPSSLTLAPSARPMAPRARPAPVPPPAQPPPPPAIKAREGWP